MLNSIVWTTAFLLIGPAAAQEGDTGTTVAPPPATAATTEQAYKKPAQLSFLRMRNDALEQPAALQVAVVRYEPIDGSMLSVTLYAAVHVGDAAYYEQLNRSFTKHDALLYELANDPEVLRQTASTPRSIFSMLQLDMASLLELSNQLDNVDYDRPNFVHADIPVGDLLQRAQDEGEDLLTIVTQTLLDMHRMMKQGDSPLGGILGSGQGDPLTSDALTEFLSGGDPRKLKVNLARQLAEQTEGGLLEGIIVLNRYLIDARNQRCMEVLEQQIKLGKSDLGIFYGAGHNPDLHRRLMVDYALTPVEVTWVDAWNLKERKSARDMSDEQLLVELLRRLVEQSDR